jgi:hypothetical protein
MVQRRNHHMLCRPMLGDVASAGPMVVVVVAVGGMSCHDGSSGKVREVRLLTPLSAHSYRCRVPGTPYRILLQLHVRHDKASDAFVLLFGSEEPK